MRTLTRSTLPLLAALLLGLAPTGLAQDAPESYVRFNVADNKKDGAMQVAIATFEHPDRKTKVILYGVVHIADAEFYARVQQDLDSYTTVLFEGVAPGKEAPTEADQSLGELQKAMGEMLGLSFQKDGINYTRKNLVHADMNMDQLKEAMGGGTISPLGQFMDADQMKSMAPFLKMAAGLGKMLMANNPAMRDQMKMQMGSQMAGQDMDKAMGEKMTQAILYDRNRVCLEVLDKQLVTQQDGSIAIFYGAAHMPDMEKTLASQGWKRVEKRWMSAWQIGQGVADGWQAPAGGAPQPQTTPSTPAPTPATPPADGRRWF